MLLVEERLTFLNEPIQCHVAVCASSISSSPLPYAALQTEA